MAAKPWESRLMEQQQQTHVAENQDRIFRQHGSRLSSHAEAASDKTPPLPKKSNSKKTPEPCSVKVRKNNVTTRISARPSQIGSSSPSSEFQYDESSASSSICTASATPKSGNGADDSGNNNTRPSYMNLTQSTKAKQKSCNYQHHHQYSRAQRLQSMDEFQFLKKTAVFSNGDSNSTACSDPSLHFSRPLYLPTYMDKRPR